MAFARKSWKIAHQMTNTDPYLSSLSSIWYNKKLLIDKKSIFWNKWIRSGIHILEDVMGDENPALCLLGLLPDNIQISKHQKLWCRLAMRTGCRITLRHWKSPTQSTFKEWVQVLSSMASYERVTYRVAGREDLFNEVWGPFLAHLLEM